MDYAWLGNVRELENMMERAIVLSSGKVIALKHLPKEIVGDKYAPPAVSVAEVSALTSQVEQFEKNIIEQALLKTGDNKAKAAQLLEISERSLWYKIKKYF
jgi:two-component system response regulator AtoC